MIYSLMLNYDQLDRVQARVRQGHALRIIHVLTEDSGQWQDCYITLIDCEPEEAVFLYLL